MLLRFLLPPGRPALSPPSSGYSGKAMGHLSPGVVYFLFLLNLGLQVFDGLSTYHGLQLGWPEGNPLVHALMVHWGAGWALLGVKSAACALLLLVYCLGTHPLIARALTLTAAYYLTFSFLPWVSLFLGCGTYHGPSLLRPG